MLKFLLLVACLLVAANACKEHETCPLEFNLQETGNLRVVYHAAPGDEFSRVIFTIKRTRRNGSRGKQRLVAKDSVVHAEEGIEAHEDWTVEFENNPDWFEPFEECQELAIIVRSRTKGLGKPEVNGNKRIPGAACPEEPEI